MKLLFAIIMLISVLYTAWEWHAARYQSAGDSMGSGLALLLKTMVALVVFIIALVGFFVVDK